MLHLKIIAVGRLKESFWTAACQEYLKRLSAYADVSIKEVPDVDPASAGGDASALEKEGNAILKQIAPEDHVILLDIKGKELSSEGIADKLKTFALNGTNDLTFVIGASLGVSAEVKARAQERWSFGPITLPHNLARVVLLEQIYRAFKIIRHEPYHK